MTTGEVIEKMKSGTKLFEYKSFKMSGQSFTSKVLPGTTIRYSLEDGIRVHHSIIKSMVKSRKIGRGTSFKTLGGTCVELVLAKD